MIGYVQLHRVLTPSDFYILANNFVELTASLGIFFAISILVIKYQDIILRLKKSFHL